MSESQKTQPEDLRRAIQIFVRRFGLLQQRRTPCGQPLSVPEAHALMILYANRDRNPLTISELGADLELDKSNVSRLCRRMEKKGHLERFDCPDDGRARRLRLTAQGLKRAEQVELASLERFAGILEFLPAEAHGRVLDALFELNRALQAAGEALP